MKNTIDEESWNRFPDARVRTRENGLKAIQEGLGEDGYCTGAAPRIHLLDDGIYVNFLLNVGKQGNIVALPFEVFLPATPLPVKKKAAKEANEDETPSEPIDTTDELRDDLETKTDTSS